MCDDEQVLTGGNASGRVVRVGGTVRKAWTETTPAVQNYLGALRARGVDAPAPLGCDQQGRQVIEYIPGTLAQEQVPLGHQGLLRVGTMVRRIHDASAFFPMSDPDGLATLLPAEDPDLMCHNDLAPWNLITGDRWVFIDWDGAGPSTRLWDLAYAAQSFGMLIEGQPVQSAAARLRALADGYGADSAMRRELPAAMAKRAAAMFELLRSSHESGFQPWADMYVTGHGEHWRAAAEYVARNQTAWEQALSPSD